VDEFESRLDKIEGLSYVEVMMI